MDVHAIWFTDIVNRYHVHRRGAGSQGYALDTVFSRFAAAAGLRPANLPTRPDRRRLVAVAVAEHADRLRAELIESAAPLVVTLGEEARQALALIADDSSGTPTEALKLARMDDRYGSRGMIRIGRYSADWITIVHPFQSNPDWTALHNAWIARQYG